MKHLLLALPIACIAATAFAQEPQLVPGGAIQNAANAELARESAKNSAALRFDPKEFQLNLPKGQSDQPVTILRGR